MTKNIVDHNGMATDKKEPVDNADTTLHTSEFDMWTLNDMFAELELEPGLYQISIKKVG